MGSYGRAMRILVIGGAGDMGQHAVRTLAEDSVVDQVIVADRDASRAEGLARAVGARATSLALDVSDPKALRAAGSADIVLNTVGPFYRHGRPVLEAAIDAGVSYADINDDWEPTLAMLELDQQ